MRTKIGLLSGGIEQYWKSTGMKTLPQVLQQDIDQLIHALKKEFDVVYPGFAGNEEDSERIGKILKKEEVDMALMYHATYIEDSMSLAFLDELGDIFPVLFHSQGPRKFSPQDSPIEAGRFWGNNSTVQLPGTLKRLRPNLRFGHVFGGLDDPRSLEESENTHKPPPPSRS